MASLGPTLPSLAENVGTTLMAMGAIFSARSLGYLSGALLGGVLYDRFKAHFVLAAWAILGALMLWFIPMVAIFTILATTMFIIGLTQGATDVGCNTQLARVHRNKVGPYLNAMFFVAGLGSFTIPLIMGSLSLDWGYQLLALALLPIALWLVFTPSPETPAQDHASKVSGSNTILVLFALLAFVYVGVEVSYGGWIFSYFSASHLGSEAAGYRLNSLFYLAITFGRLFAIPLAAHVKSQRIIWGYLAGAVFSVALMVVFSGNPWSIWLGTFGMGLSLAAIFPTTFSYVGSKTQLSGKQTGVVWASGSFGAMLLPWLIGQGMDFRGPTTMMVILLVLWILALGVFWMLNRVAPEIKPG